METLECLLEDREMWWDPEATETDAVPALLRSREVPYTTIEGWQRLDEHELELGAAEGRTRIKVVPREDMTRISRGE
jgi:ferredoxin--NADP+ reductase